MKTKIAYISIAGIALMVLLAGCGKEPGSGYVQQGGNNYLSIEGEIVGAGIVTRAQTDVLGSSRSFEDGDMIGFYSFHKNGCVLSYKEHIAQGDPVEYLRNEPLAYAAGAKKFTSSTIENVVMNTLGLTFAYFPYSDRQAPASYVKWNGAGHVPLDRHDHYIHIFDEEGQVRDLLTATKRQYTDVNYRFTHRFSMALLFLGKGFSPDDNPQLTIQLTERVAGAHLTRKWGSSGVPPDVFDFTVDRVPLDHPSDVGSASFTAVKRGPYIMDGETEARIAYTVVLPYGSVIDYIELVDTDGRIQRVKASELVELESGWIYPATIRMDDGLEPTIYPHEIIPWGDPEKITVDRLQGIYSAEEFEEWCAVYNGCVDDLPAGVTDDDVLEALEKYGVYDDATQKWTFYIRDNIDCADIVNTTGTFIAKLVDGVTIDGGRYKIENIMLDLKGLEPAVGMGLVGEIEGGDLMNMQLYFPTVRYKGTKPSGCIAAVVSGGRIENCTVREAAMMCRSATGTLAGRMVGGAVDRCKFHGAVQAAVPAGVEPAYRGVIGEMSEGASIGTITNNVRFVELE